MATHSFEQIDISGLINAEFPTSAEIVVIGSGIVGLSTAYYLARRGCRNVVVLEATEFLGGITTNQCGGGIRSQFTSSINIQLSLLSDRLRKDLESEADIPLRLQKTGYVFMASSREYVARLQAALPLLHAAGIGAQWLEKDDLAEMLPMMELHGVSGGSYHSEDGRLDVHAVVNSYKILLTRLNVQQYTEAEVVQLMVTNGRVQKVVTSRGEITTHVVINAAGPWAGKICRMVDYKLPVTTFAHQYCVTSPLDQFRSDQPTVIFQDDGIGFRHKDNSVVFGATRPRPFRHSGPPPIDKTFDKKIYKLASKRLPSLQSITILESLVGLYEITPDEHSIVGPLPGTEGFFCAAGFNGHGFMHAPATGYLLSELVLDGRSNTLDTQLLSIQRFMEHTAL